MLGMTQLIGDNTFPPKDAVIGGTQAAESAACILLVFISPAVVLSSRACKQDVKYCGQAAARSTRAAGRVPQPSCAHASRAVAARLSHRVFTLACNSTYAHSRTDRCNRGVKISDGSLHQYMH